MKCLWKLWWNVSWKYTEVVNIEREMKYNIYKLHCLLSSGGFSCYFNPDVLTCSSYQIVHHSCSPASLFGSVLWIKTDFIFYLSLFWFSTFPRIYGLLFLHSHLSVNLLISICCFLRHILHINLSLSVPIQENNLIGFPHLLKPPWDPLATCNSPFPKEQGRLS